MNPIVECIMAGGPEHGLVLFLQTDPQKPELPAAMAADGMVCRAAACRPSTSCTTRYVLLHPHASGNDLMDVLGPSGDATRQLPRSPCEPTLAA